MPEQADTVAGATSTSTSHTDSREAVEMSAAPASPAAPSDEFTDAAQQHQQTLPTSTPALTTTTTPSPPQPIPLTRQETEALGPAADSPIAHPTSTNTAAGPTLNISLMLTTGARHPYKIDQSYLLKRKVEARNTEGAFEPRELSGYQLKELIWTDWRSEWEPRPASPSSIRLIILGRMIEDKMMLRDFPFNIETINVVHMTVKPADLIDDDETGAKGSGKGGALRAHDTEDQGAGCRCIIS